MFFRLVDCYASYFGALTSVAWSPDGRFILVNVSSCIILVTLSTNIGNALIFRLVVRMIS